MASNRELPNWTGSFLSLYQLLHIISSYVILLSPDTLLSLSWSRVTAFPITECTAHNHTVHTWHTHLIPIHSAVYAHVKYGLLVMLYTSETLPACWIYSIISPYHYPFSLFSVCERCFVISFVVRSFDSALFKDFNRLITSSVSYIAFLPISLIVPYNCW